MRFNKKIENRKNEKSIWMYVNIIWWYPYLLEDIHVLIQIIVSSLEK